MKKIFFSALIIFSMIGLNSCHENKGVKSSSSRTMMLPNISGAAGEILVVMDNFNWKNNAGEIIRKTLQQEYPALTQPEPIFDVSHITTGAFDQLFQMHRTIIKVNIDPEIKESKIKYGENLWAKPQLVVLIEAANNQDLGELLEKEKNNVLQNILYYDRQRLQNLYNDSKDQEIKNLVSKFNISMSIPRGYNIDFSKDDFASISIETPKTSQVIFLYQYPYTGDEDLQTSNIIEKRNAFLKKYTLGSRRDSYITTAKLFDPISYDVKINGKKAIEVRGWWELHNGFMGGPFISHSIVDKKRNTIVVVEGYVYNPNNKKRNMMRQLEAIIYSAEFLNK